MFLTGCYSLQPIRSTPEPGTVVALDITDAGRVALGGTMGPEIIQVQGRLISRDSSEYVLGVTGVNLLRGGTQTWRGETVRIRSEHVSSLYERRFSKGRTIALGAIGVGAIALIATQGLLGAANQDPPKMPVDTLQAVLRPRRP
jgi:hypothetical protein